MECSQQTNKNTHTHTHRICETIASINLFFFNSILCTKKKREKAKGPQLEKLSNKSTIWEIHNSGKRVSKKKREKKTFQNKMKKTQN